VISQNGHVGVRSNFFLPPDTKLCMPKMSALARYTDDF